MRTLDFIIPTVEIATIACAVYFVLIFFWNTRAMDLLLGILVFVVFYALSTLLKLPVLQKLMLTFFNVAAIGLLIIFQPELRTGLSKLGFRRRKYRAISEFDRFVDGIAHAVYRMSERRTGALVVLENQHSLDEYVTKGVPLYASFTPELLESLFSTTTPLHDGGVIIRSTTVLSAATIFPLADESAQITKSMGTRHRAALGLSQLSDALVIVVSEETGNVAIARDGIITRGVKIDRFKGILRSVFTPPARTMGEGIKWINEWKEWIFQ